MKCVFKSIVFISIFSISINALSATYVWKEGAVDRVYPQANGDFIITFKDESPDCTNSVSPKYHWVKLGENSVTAEGLNQMFSIALAAGASGNSINVSFDKDSPNCYIRKLFIQF